MGVKTVTNVQYECDLCHAVKPQEDMYTPTNSCIRIPTGVMVTAELENGTTTFEMNLTVDIALISRNSLSEPAIICKECAHKLIQNYLSK